MRDQKEIRTPRLCPAKAIKLTPAWFIFHNKNLRMSFSHTHMYALRNANAAIDPYSVSPVLGIETESDDRYVCALCQQTSQPLRYRRQFFNPLCLHRRRRSLVQFVLPGERGQAPLNNKCGIMYTYVVKFGECSGFADSVSNTIRAIQANQQLSMAREVHRTQESQDKRKILTKTTIIMREYATLIVCENMRHSWTHEKIQFRWWWVPAVSSIPIAVIYFVWKMAQMTVKHGRWTRQKVGVFFWLRIAFVLHGISAIWISVSSLLPKW